MKKLDTPERVKEFNQLSLAFEDFAVKLEWTLKAYSFRQL